MADARGGNYITSQNYKYDNLYQLTAVSGNTEYRNSGATANPTFVSTYSQTYNFDKLGNKNLNHRCYAFKQKLVFGVAFYADAVKAAAKPRKIAAISYKNATVY